MARFVYFPDKSLLVLKKQRELISESISPVFNPSDSRLET